MATHSIILVWKIPWTEEPVGYSPKGHKVLDTTERQHIRMGAEHLLKRGNNFFQVIKSYIEV